MRNIRFIFMLLLLLLYRGYRALTTFTAVYSPKYCRSHAGATTIIILLLPCTRAFCVIYYILLFVTIIITVVVVIVPYINIYTYIHISFFFLHTVLSGHGPPTDTICDNNNCVQDMLKRRETM